MSFYSFHLLLHVELIDDRRCQSCTRKLRKLQMERRCLIAFGTAKLPPVSRCISFITVHLSRKSMPNYAAFGGIIENAIRNTLAIRAS